MQQEGLVMTLLSDQIELYSALYGMVEKQTLLWEKVYF
jgi:hypothetical protein